MMRSALASVLLAWITGLDGAAQVEAAAKVAGQPAYWIGLWPNVIARFDPNTDEVVQRIQLRGELQWGKTLSHDRQRFWVITDQKTKVEVVDLAKGAVVDVHDFAEDGWIIRVSSVKEVPGGTHWYVRVDRVKRELDHFVVKAEQYLYYDIANKKVEKRIDDLPKSIRRGARISPDGTMWHVFDGDIKIVDPATLKEVGKIDLTTPVYTGMGAVEVYGDDFYDGQNPGAYRMLFRMTDPVQKKRRVFGRVDIDVTEKKIAGIQEWGPSPDFWSFEISQDKKTAAAMGREGDMSKLALFDMTNGKKLCESFEEFRPRRALAGISPDGSKIYVGGAGNDFLIFDRDLKRVKTVWLDADLFGGFTVIGG